MLSIQKTIKIIGLIILMTNLAAAGQSNSAKKEPVKLEIKSFDWQGLIPQSRLVVLKNKYGSIRSRNQSGNEIFVHASIQLIGDTPLEPQFLIRDDGDYLTIEVAYNDFILDDNNQLRGRTDVSILFPDTVSIYAETDKGMIKIDKTASHVEAVSQSGDIKLTTTGLFIAKSSSGDISLRLRGQKLLGDSQATTDSGKIKADIFNDMALVLSTKTNGETSLNGDKKLKGFIYNNSSNLTNGNQSRIEFSSVSGDILLNVIAPPALIHSVKPSNVTSIDVDLRDLKKSKQWKPGDPIIERDDKRTPPKGKDKSASK